MINLEALQTFFTRLSKRERTILYCTSLVLAVLIFVKLLVEPWHNRMQALDEEIASKKRLLQLDLRLLAVQGSVRDARVKSESYFSKASTPEEELTVSLKEIEALANSSGVYVESLRPGEILNEGVFKKYLINISCEGEMASIVSFIYAIENSDKLLTVEKYTIVPKTEESSVASIRMTVSKCAIY